MRRGHVVLWVSLGTGVVVAVLVAVLAFAGSPSEVAAHSPLIGKRAPAVSGPAGGAGGRVALSAYAGEWVLVNFAASWCVPCQQELPDLLAFQRAHAAARDATVMTVEYDEADLPGLRAFLQSHGARWPVVDDPAATVDYGVGGLPESYLVNPGGRVVAKITGGVRAAQLDQLVAVGQSQ